MGAFVRDFIETFIQKFRAFPQLFESNGYAKKLLSKINFYEDFSGKFSGISSALKEQRKCHINHPH